MTSKQQRLDKLEQEVAPETPGGGVLIYFDHETIEQAATRLGIDLTKGAWVCIPHNNRDPLPARRLRGLPPELVERYGRRE